MHRKRYLIVGGAGFVGRHLTAKLEAEPSSEVVWLVRSPEGAAGRPGSLLINDLRSEPARLAAFDEVVYAASGTVPSTKEASALGELERNLRPLCELLGLLGVAPEAGFTYLSSAGTVYDTAFGRAHEDSPIRPLSNYAAGKLAGEAFVRVFGEGRPGRVSVVRAANLYGPGQQGMAGFGLIPAVCKCASDGGELILYRGGLDRRDYLHIDDFCDGLAAVFESASGVYNLASGKSHTAIEVIEVFADVSGIKLATKASQTTASPAGDVLLDISCSREKLGWSPRISLEKGIRSTWEWWCEAKLGWKEARRS